MDKWVYKLGEIYLRNRYTNTRKAIAARRDQYRHIQGLPMIYSSVHGIRIPESEFDDKDIIKNTDFVKSNIHPMERRRMQLRA